MSIDNKLLMRRQSGDTIVEVIIVLAVLGLALGIAYSTASKSLLATRAAQENTQATQLIQAQVERLYALAPNPSSGPADQYIFSIRPTAFCINTANKIVATTDADCNPPPVPYHVAVLYCTGNSDPSCTGHGSDDTFILTATWENVQGQGNDSSQISYRIHQAP